MATLHVCYCWTCPFVGIAAQPAFLLSESSPPPMAAPFSSRRAGSGARGVGESLILKRRQREDHLASYATSVKGFLRANSRAEWEDSLYDKGEKKQVRRAVAQLKNQHESQLHSRRLRYGRRRGRTELWKLRSSSPNFCSLHTLGWRSCIIERWRSGKTRVWPMWRPRKIGNRSA